MSITSAERQIENSLIPTPRGRHSYSEDYKTTTFRLWYKTAKPGATKLWEIMEVDPISGVKPSIAILAHWIADFKNSAVILDEEVATQLKDIMVAEKVEMLNRHAETGIKLQNMAMEYIKEHEEELKVPMAVKMLIEGVRIERESRGVPQALEKMMNKSDDDLLKDVIALINKAPVEFEQIEGTFDVIDEGDNG